MSNKHLYIFLDEAGNFDFSTKGTKYFILTTMTLSRNWDNLYSDLYNLKYALIERGLDIESFHCCEDNVRVRKSVFDILEKNLAKSDVRIDSIIIEKRKTYTGLQNEKDFYTRMMGYLLNFVLNTDFIDKSEEVIVITDTIPINKKRKTIEKILKQALKQIEPKGKNFRIMHHNSCSHLALQIVDYCNWAMFRKWERNDTLFYEQIKPFIKSEFEIFKNGNKYYY